MDRCKQMQRRQTNLQLTAEAALQSCGVRNFHNLQSQPPDEALAEGGSKETGLSGNCESEGESGGGSVKGACLRKLELGTQPKGSLLAEEHRHSQRKKERQLDQQRVTEDVISQQRQRQ
jgi:hypothetical protein